MSTLPAVSSPPGTTSEADARLFRQEVQLILPEPDSPAASLLRRGFMACQAGVPIARSVNVPEDSPPTPYSAPAPDLRLGKNVAWDEARAVFIAQKSGHVRISRVRLEVDETLDLPEDLDAATGPVTFEGPVIVRRNILDMAVLKSAGTITVYGAIEAGDVTAGGDLHVHHGICGKERGRVTAAGRLLARFLTNAQVASGGDMVIANEIANTRLTCGGILKVERGTILGGHATAFGGILCHTAGSDVGVKTLLEIGLAPEKYAALSQAAAIQETSLQKARDIRSVVEPLLAHAKNLTAAQKEKATELLYLADEADTLATKASAALEQSKEPLQACLGTSLTIIGTLHPGVLIRYPIAEAQVPTTFRGPVEIALQCKGGSVHIVVVDRYRNTTVPLPTATSTDAVADVSRRLMVGTGVGVPTHRAGASAP